MTHQHTRAMHMTTSTHAYTTSTYTHQNSRMPKCMWYVSAVSRRKLISISLSTSLFKLNLGYVPTSTQQSKHRRQLKVSANSWLSVSQPHLLFSSLSYQSERSMIIVSETVVKWILWLHSSISLAHIHTYIHTYKQPHSTYLHIHTHACTHACTHTHISTHRQTYQHICTHV